MPELSDQMYCSQQICIPPTFPYVLRQFAKAAIRTQPNDLLKWATTYFRCLSLNIPPPVKPRLEYPIPKDYYGLTPGWLQTLLKQMMGSQTVTFKVLWDRWIGACLQHQNLIQILVLAGFEDNTAIPWLRFLGICAAHLTENLTQTMILICEILTEEPEGGSAMIPIEIFVDLYRFLAQIDASVPQTLRNYYFLDKFLELYQEKIAKDSGAGAIEEAPDDTGLTPTSSESTLKSEGESKKDDGGSLISCPSATSQDPDNYMRLLMKIRSDEEGEYDDTNEPILEKIEEQEITSENKSVDQGSDEQSLESKKESMAPEPDKTFPEQLEEDKNIEISNTQDDAESRDTQVSTPKSQPNKKDKIEDEYLLEDLERLKAVQQELMGEDDDDLEKYKTSILLDAGLTPSQVEAPEHFETKIEDEKEEVEKAESLKSEVSSKSIKSVQEEVDEREYEEVFVEAIPGIGAKVSEEMITAVCNYVKDMATLQHGMIMPRNLRHYDCPPLEVYRN